MPDTPYCPASPPGDLHRLDLDRHHCPPTPRRLVPCGWVICRVCRAFVEIATGKWTRGGNR